jgi:hypothetical protein
MKTKWRREKMETHLQFPAYRFAIVLLALVFLILPLMGQDSGKRDNPA